MNVFKLFVFFGSLAVLMFSSCDPSKRYAVELKQLDSLSNSLDSAQVKFAAIDTIEIHKHINELNINLNFIENNNSDTVNRETAFVLSDYSALHETFKKINKEYIELMKKQKESKEQILNLIHDLKNGKVQEEKIPVYIKDEQTEADRVIQGVEVLSESTKTSVEKFEMNQPKVLAFIEKIKAKQIVKK
jgi:hypothetical protein